MACCFIAKAIIHDERKILTVSTCVRDLHGITNDVYLSMPCVVGAKGVSRVVDLPLSKWESNKLKESAIRLWEAQSEVWEELDEE